MSAGGAIIAFYEGSAPDHRGRYLRDVQRWPGDRLEAVHDFIQWLFPLTEPSPVNPSAPILDTDSIDEFARRPELQENLRASFLRMLAFYGMEFSGGAVIKAPSFAERSRNWISPGNHNHLRITRILRCLSLLGLGEEARAFYNALAAIYQENRSAISTRTFQFWTEAVTHLEK